MRIRTQGALYGGGLSCMLTGCATVSAILSEPAPGPGRQPQPLQIGKLIKKRHSRRSRL
jgi:hypothetical protein